MMLRTVVGRYLFRELLPPFFLNLFFFTFIFLLTRILDIMNLVVNYKVGMGVVGRMLVYHMPYFLVYVVPMSVMMAVLLTFLRMSSDNEVLALKSGGVSLYGLLPPVLMFCLVGMVLTAFMIVQGLPWGRRAMADLTREVASENIDIGLKERTFNDAFDGVMLYVNKVDVRSKELIDIFIQDRRDPDLPITIVAPRGKLFKDPDRPVFHLRLTDGTLNGADLDDRTVNAARFDTYDINLDVQKALSSSKDRRLDEKEMYFGELVRYIRETEQRDSKYWEAVMEFHKKFSLPFACLAMGVLAVPLGVGSKFSRRSFGLGLGLTFFLFYYLLLSAGLVFGETGAYPPVIGMWVPNLVMGAVGLYLLVRAANDRPIQFGFMRGPFLLLRAGFDRLRGRQR